MGRAQRAKRAAQRKLLIQRHTHTSIAAAAFRFKFWWRASDSYDNCNTKLVFQFRGKSHKKHIPLKLTKKKDGARAARKTCCTTKAADPAAHTHTHTHTLLLLLRLSGLSSGGEPANHMSNELLGLFLFV